MAVNSRIDFYVTIDWCINVGNKLDDVKHFGDIREDGAKGFSDKTYVLMMKWQNINYVGQQVRIIILNLQYRYVK